MARQEGRVLTLTPETFAVFKYTGEKALPPKDASKRYSFFSVTITPEECSVIAPENYLTDILTKGDKDINEESFEVDKNWRCFKVEGPLDFNLVGILHRILDPLKSAKISALAVGTFDTDYFLVKKDKLEEAYVALKEAGFIVNE